MLTFSLFSSAHTTITYKQPIIPLAVPQPVLMNIKHKHSKAERAHRKKNN